MYSRDESSLGICGRDPRSQADWPPTARGLVALTHAEWPPRDPSGFCRQDGLFGQASPPGTAGPGPEIVITGGGF